MLREDPVENASPAAESIDLTRHRRRLAARLKGAVLLALGAVSCGNTGGSTGVDNGYDTVECFAWPQAAVGGSGGAAGGSSGAGGTSSGGAGAGGTSSGGAGGTSAGGAGGMMAPPCPVGDDAVQYMDGNNIYCGVDTVASTTHGPSECCYKVHISSCAAGRPFIVDGEARTAPLRIEARPPGTERSGEGWASGRNDCSSRPDVSGLTPQERALLADAWARDGLFEHASIASFSRFALELLALGAPPSLLGRAHEAALDEVSHARMAFSFASAYAGAEVGPGAFPFAGPVEVSRDVADIAARAVREGCVGETLASVVAAEQARVAKDPAVRSALLTIAEDEARHAELAWAAVAWMLKTGGNAARRAIDAAFAEALADVPLDIVAGGGGALEAHGRPAASVLEAAIDRALVEVIRPAIVTLRETSPERADPPRARDDKGIDPLVARPYPRRA